MNNLTKFNYNGFDISFDPENNGVMINATEMAKPFGKQPKDYLRTNPAQEFINALKESRSAYMPNDDFQPVMILQGGTTQGTWMHEDVALDFAQWLSPHFKVWCLMKLKELLKTGKTEIQPKSDAEKIAEGYTLALQTVEILKMKNEELSTTIKLQAPIVEYANTVLLSPDTLKATQVGAEFGMSAMKFNKTLKDLGIHRKVNGQWVICAKYAGLGYTKTETYTYENQKTGISGTSTTTVWTEKGKQFLHEILKEYKFQKQA